MKKIVVYIAGPYRAPTNYEVEQNVREAEALILPLASAGFTPLCPHSMFRFFHGTMDDQYWLDATLYLLGRADCVLLVPGWEASVGTRREVAQARLLDMPVFENMTDLIRWSRG